MRFVPIKKLQMQSAPGFIGESLEEFPGQPKPERAGHVLAPVLAGQATKLPLVQLAPDQMRASAEVDHAASQAFIHRNVGFAGERVARVKPGSVTANAFLVTQRLAK